MPQPLPKIGDEVPALPPIGGEVVESSALVPPFTPLVQSREPNTVGTFARHVGQQLNPVPLGQMVPFPKSLGGGGWDAPIRAAKDVLKAQGDVGDRMVQSYRDGDYVSAAAHALHWLLPVIGPVLDQAGSHLAKGEYAAGMGDTAGLATSIVAPTLIGKAQGVKVKPVLKNPNPAEAAAAEFGRARGVPVSAGAASGNRFVKGAQALSDHTILGVGSKAQQAEAAGLTRVGAQLADDARLGAVTTDQAGATIASALEGKIQAHAQYATRAYDTLRAIEADPAQARSVQVAVMKGKPVMETMPLPVDLRAAKAQLKPIYQQLTRQYSVTQAQASTGYKALGNIVNGPDYGPLSQVEADLGAIKSIARGAEMAELRTQSQGLAATGVKSLQSAVDATAHRAGPKAVRALHDGRAATAEKFSTAEVWDTVKAEPVQAYRQAVAPQDSAIDKLRTIAKQTPQSVPQIARAWLDEALGQATAEGGFQHAAKLDANWRRLGPETKKILFPQAGQAQALDQFFLLAKMLADNPNPSGSALVGNLAGQGALMLTAPMTGTSLVVSSGALSRLLHSPAAVRAMTKGFTVLRGPGRTSPALASAAVGDLVRAAREAGVSLAAPGAAADSPPEGRPR